MGFVLSSEEGVYLVRLARDAIDKALRSEEVEAPGDAPGKLKQHCGVFVTLNKMERNSHRLRGCIGFPYPLKPLVEALVDSAVSAALRDPRFPPVSSGEMGSIALEVSVLTPPEVLVVEKPSEYPSRIEVGVDGLVVSRGERSGLLLPQVPVEWGWDGAEFLTQCSMKAMLPPDAWLLPGTEVSKFQAIIFAEEEPMGAVRQVELQ